MTGWRDDETIAKFAKRSEEIDAVVKEPGGDPREMFVAESEAAKFEEEENVGGAE